MPDNALNTPNLWKPVGTEWFPGWYLIGQYESDVGSWLLHHQEQALLLEIPEGLEPDDVSRALKEIGCDLKYITASHDHYDHVDEDVLHRIGLENPQALYIRPENYPHEFCLTLAGEPLWIIPSPKHSPRDMVIVFRGVAMTGDIELGTLESRWNEVPMKRRIKSMNYLQGFERRNQYHAHTIVSAHLDDVRQGVNFSELFRYEPLVRPRQR